MYSTKCSWIIIAITGTWLPKEETLSNHVIGDISPKGYKMSHIPRNTRQRGEGVGICKRNPLTYELPLNMSADVDHIESFEYAEYLLKSSTWIRLVVVYRPPPSTANGMNVAQFFGEFSTAFLEHLVLLPVEILIMGISTFTSTT